MVIETFINSKAIATIKHTYVTRRLILMYPLMSNVFIELSDLIHLQRPVQIVIGAIREAIYITTL